MQTLQLFAYDQAGARWELDLYEEDPIKLTISSEDIIDIPRIDASFSRQFRIPATQNNSQFFKYWYIAGVIDFDVTKKISAEIHVNGLFYKAGQLRMESVYENKQTGQLDFEIIFLGETKDFATQVGEGFLIDLDLADIAHELDTYAITDGWRDFGDPDLFLNGAVRYIVAQRGNTWNNEDAPIEPSEISFESITWNNGGPDADQDGGTFVRPNNPIPITMFTPIIQVKYLIDKIFARTDYTYSSDSVFWEDWFQYLYTDGIPEANVNIPAVNAVFDAYKSQSEQIGTGETEVVFDTENSDPTNAYSNSTGHYTVPIAGTHTFDAQVVASDVYFSYPYGGFTAKLIKRVGNTVTVLDSVSQTAFGLGPFTAVLPLAWTGSLNVGDIVLVTIEPIGGSENPGIVADQTTFQCTNAPAAISVNNLLKDDIKIIDFFRSVLTKFRLVMVPSKDVPYEFIIKPWKDYIGTGDLFDWTDKLAIDKDVQVKPVFFSQSAVISFTDQQDEDVQNKYHLDTANHVYGRRLYDSQNELIKDTREVTTIFAPTPVTQALGAAQGSDEIIPWLCSWPNGEMVNHGSHTHAKLTPLRVKPRLLWWNGVTPSTTWYWTTYPGFRPHQQPGVIINSSPVLPRVSYLSEIPSTSNTVDLNWQKDFSYFSVGGGPDGDQGSDVYSLYWSDYIDDLYSPEARIMTAYFNIGSDELRDLTFDDVIFIKDSYWRVQKIYDAPLNEIQTVKVDLIRVINYNPTIVTTPATANEFWSAGEEQYDEAIGTWSQSGPPVYQIYTVQSYQNPIDVRYAEYYGPQLEVGFNVNLVGETDVYSINAPTINTPNAIIESVNTEFQPPEYPYLFETTLTDYIRGYNTDSVQLRGYNLKGQESGTYRLEVNLDLQVLKTLTLGESSPYDTPQLVSTIKVRDVPGGVDLYKTVLNEQPFANTTGVVQHLEFIHDFDFVNQMDPPDESGPISSAFSFSSGYNGDFNTNTTYPNGEPKAYVPNANSISYSGTIKLRRIA